MAIYTTKSLFSLVPNKKNAFMNIMHSQQARDFLLVWMNSGVSYQAQTLDGVFAAAERSSFPLHILIEKQTNPTLFHSRHCVGVIGFLSSREDQAFARALTVPVINLSNGNGRLEGVGNLLSDDREVGRSAARHLLSRGHQVLLGIGQSGRQWSADRLRGFAGEGERAGASVHLIDFPSVRDNESFPDWSPLDYMTPRAEALRPHLADFPPDAGIFGANDRIVWMVQHTLFTLYPERLHTTGLVGVGNSRPGAYTPGELRGLSSVRVGFGGMGAEALQWFANHLGEGKEAVSDLYRLISPEGVTVQASTAGRACKHPRLSLGLRWAWSQLREGEVTNVKALAEKLHMSTRTLERLCEAHTQQTARRVLLDMRLDYACQLLRESPELSVGRVGECCGFQKSGHFAAMFKSREGKTPLRYRKDLPPS